MRAKKLEIEILDETRSNFETAQWRATLNTSKIAKQTSKITTDHSIMGKQPDKKMSAAGFHGPWRWVKNFIFY